MTTLENILKFQIEYNAIILPKTNSITFINVDRYVDNNNIYQGVKSIAWLHRETIMDLAKERLNSVEYFNPDSDVHLSRLYNPPSSRETNPNMSYSDKSIGIYDGRHRTRTYIYEEAVFIPINLYLEDILRMEADGYHIPFYTHNKTLTRKQGIINTFHTEKDPVNILVKDKIKNINNIIGIFNIYLKLFSFDIFLGNKSMKINNGLGAPYCDYRYIIKQAEKHLYFIKKSLPILIELKKHPIEEMEDHLDYSIYNDDINTPPIELFYNLLVRKTLS